MRGKRRRGQSDESVKWCRLACGSGMEEQSEAKRSRRKKEGKAVVIVAIYFRQKRLCKEGIWM